MIGLACIIADMFATNFLTSLVTYPSDITVILGIIGLAALILINIFLIKLLTKTK